MERTIIVLTASTRAKLRHYAAQDRIDAAFFEYIGEPEKAAQYRKRAEELEAKANETV